MKKQVLVAAGVCLVQTFALAQVTTVRGTVSDATTGEPVIGANVVVKGHSGVGAVTNLDGKFVLNAPKGAKELLVSYIGYKSLTMPIKSNLVIKLEPDNSLLDDVVVTAVGITRTQKSLGYSTQKVSAKDLSSTRIADVNNALVGKVSGVRFIGGSGATFNPGKIVLRGTNNLTPGGSEPIYVVDGVITNKLMINMDDVESVNVLKGPAATALYGSEGGNGAIIITSKGVSQGQARTEVQLSHTLTAEYARTSYKYQNQYGGGSSMNTYKWKEGDDPGLKSFDGMRYPDYDNDVSWGAKFDGKPYIPWYAWDKTHPDYGKTALWTAAKENNLLELFRTGVSNTTNVSLLRAGKDHTSRISFTNIDRTGITPNSDATRRYLTFKTKFSPLKHLNVGLDYKYTYLQNHNPMSEEYAKFGTIYSYTQWFHTDVDLAKLKDYKRPDGSYRTWNISDYNDFTPKFHNSPFAMFHEINRYDTYQWHVFSADADYEITPKLKVGVKVNGNLRTSLHETQVSDGFITDALKSRYSQIQTRTIDMRTIGRVSYSDKFFDNKLTLDATGYAEERRERYDNLDASTTDGLSANNLFNLSASNGKIKGSNLLNSIRQQSLYGNLVLGWDNTYYLDFSGRNDWHSSLPKNANSFFYGGVSGSIMLSNFLPKNNILNYWKLRASVAQVGSTLDPYRIQQTYLLGKFGNTTFQEERLTLFNQTIRPTISSSYEVGTEFRLFGGRLFGDLNFYQRIAKDQIIAASVVPFSGYSSHYVNVGKVENKGVELSLGGTLIKTKDFEWELNANVSKNSNKLLELYGNETDRYRVAWQGFGSKAYLWAEVGRPLGTIRTSGLEYAPDGQLLLSKKADVERYKPKAELEKTNPDAYRKQMARYQAQVEDRAESGDYRLTLSNDEERDYGTVQPDATGGFSTSIRYKGLSLRASFDWQLGGRIVSVTNMFGEQSGLLASTAGLNDRGGNVRESVSKGNGGVHVHGVVKSNGADGKPVYTPVDTYIGGRQYYEDLGARLGNYVYDASYLKMREISLTYELPKSLLKKVGFVKAASVALVATNPWLIYSAVPNIDVSEAANAFSGFMETGQTVSSGTLGFTVNLTL